MGPGAPVLSPKPPQKRDGRGASGQDVQEGPSSASPLLSPTMQRFPNDRAYFIAKELLTTERTYLKDLEVVSVVRDTHRHTTHHNNTTHHNTIHTNTTHSEDLPQGPGGGERGERHTQTHNNTTQHTTTQYTPTQHNTQRGPTSRTWRW